MLSKYQEQLNEVKTLINKLGSNVNEATICAQKGLNNLNVDDFESASSKLKNFEQNANEVDKSIITTLALFGPEAVDLRELVSFLKITSELVRISDNIKKFSKRMKNHIRNEVDFSLTQEYSQHLAKSAFSAISLSLSALKNADKDEVNDIYRKTSVEESKTDDLYSILEKNIMADLCKDITKATDSIEVLSTMRKLERMADRAVNITRLMLFARVGGELHYFG